MFRVVAVFRLVRLMRSMPEVRGAGSLIIFGLFDSFPHCVHTPGNDTTECKLRTQNAEESHNWYSQVVQNVLESTTAFEVL